MSDTKKSTKSQTCHSCARKGSNEDTGTFLLYGISQWAKMPLFAFKMCQGCLERIKGNVEAEIAEATKPKIEVVQ